MSIYRQREDGRWVPDEQGGEEAFGVVWERFWRQRKERGEWWLPSLIRSYFDTRAVRNV